LLSKSETFHCQVITKSKHMVQVKHQYDSWKGDQVQDV